MTQASRRAVEVGTAVAIGATGAVVAAESLTHDIGWNDNGPGPGYFPFRIGLLLVAAAAVLALQALRATAASPFVTREELARAFSVFWPTAGLAAAMGVLGCYVPSIVYLVCMMRRHGGYGWPASVAWGVGAGAAFFVVFDIWFRVPLAKGFVEAALGLY
jgi:putative tricarboxylic transport membrane protein